MQPEVLILADDVTGALDSGVAFAARGMRVIAALSPERLPAAMVQDGDVVVVSTNTREGTAQAAHAVVAKMRPYISGFRGILMKKVDSRLKGHISAEIDALALPRERALLVCPAIPKLGRHVEGGNLRGAGVASPIPVAPRIGHPAQIVDATRQEEIVEALPKNLAVPVYVGAAGLAEALATRCRSRSEARGAEPPPPPALLAIGSRDPVTLAQVAAIHGVPLVAAPNGEVPVSEIATTTLVQMMPGDFERPAAEAVAAFSSGIAGLLEHAPINTLLASGGETAAAILRDINVGLLRIRGELLPGVPLSDCLDGPRRIAVVTKSGGFGAPDTLVKLVSLLANSPDPNATGEKRITMGSGR